MCIRDRVKGEVASGEINLSCSSGRFLSVQLNVIEVVAVLYFFSTIVYEEARSLVQAGVHDLTTRGRGRGVVGACR